MFSSEMEQKIAQREAEAEAAFEISEEHSGDMLADKFRKLEVEAEDDDIKPDPEE